MTNDTLPKTASLLGFIALTIGMFTAYREPATGFELSIYTSTPLVFWIGSCFALIVSVFVLFSNTSKEALLAGGFLGGFSMMTIVSLPIIRGYHYLGAEDSLSHLGTARDMNAGLMPMTESGYPAVHTIGSVLHDATGLAFVHVMLLVVVVFIGIYIIFVPLAVRQLTGDTMTTYIGVFSGLLLLPLNHVSPSTHIHPTSQALMFAPAFLFVFFALYQRPTWRASFLFVFTALFFILLHPQQAANLVAFCGVVAVVQIGSHIYYGDGFTRYKEWILPEVTVYAIMFGVWVQNLGSFWSAIEAVYMIPFTDTRVAETTATRSFSLAAVGGSLTEIFIKLFFVTLLFAFLTALLMLSELIWKRSALQALVADKTITSDGGVSRVNIRYIFYGLFAIGAIFLVYLIGGISDQYFRHLGMLMVFASILGSIALGRIFWYTTARHSVAVGRRTVGTFVLFCLVLSMPIVFASPYIYDTADPVTEMQMSGYETTFEHQSESIVFEDVRSTTSRYGNAIQGRNIPEEAYYRRDEPRVPNHFADQNLPAFYEEPTYVPVPEADRKRDAVLWRGFRFSHDDFEYLDSDSGIDRVQTNGGYDLYLVNG